MASVLPASIPAGPVIPFIILEALLAIASWKDCCVIFEAPDSASSLIAALAITFEARPFTVAPTPAMAAPLISIPADAVTVANKFAPPLLAPALIASWYAELCILPAISIGVIA